MNLKISNQAIAILGSMILSFGLGCGYGQTKQIQICDASHAGSTHSTHQQNEKFAE